MVDYRPYKATGFPVCSAAAVRSDAKHAGKTSVTAIVDAPTVCVLCSQNCGLRVDIDNNRIVAIRADATNPLSDGYSCSKAYQIGHYVNHAQRLETPLKRAADGSYQPISWDQATTEIGDKLRQIRADHGPDSLAFVGIGGQGNHMSVLYALAFLAGTGSKWWFNALAQEKTQRALVDGWMMASPHDVMSVGHIEESDYALLLGSNPLISQRGIAPNRAIRDFQRDETRTLVVADPRRSETARKADIHLRPKVGTDVYLLLGIAAVIVQERLYDESFIAQRTVGFENVAAVFEDICPYEMASLCGIDATVLQDVARGFAAADRAAIEMDLGLEQSRFNTLTAYLIRLIMGLTNNLGKVGGLVFVGSMTPRVPRSRRTPRTATESGIPGVRLFAPTPMYSPNLFAEEVLADRPDRIRAVIVEGSNPMLQYADTSRTREAFDRLELSVVIEPTETETTRVADYVLPTPVGYEKWECASFPKAYPLLGAQVRPPVVSGPERALPEPEIYYRIASKMGLIKPAPKLVARLARKAARSNWTLPYLAVLAPLALVRARSRARALPMMLFWLYETLGKTLRAPQLAAFWLLCQSVAWTRKGDIARGRPDLTKGWNRAAIGNRLYREAMAHPEGVVLGRVDEDRCLEQHLGYRDGRIRLFPPAMRGEIQRALADQAERDPDYPFILDGGMRTRWTANANFRDPAWRKGAGPHCAVRMNSDDAASLGIEKGTRVRVRTKTGSVELPALPEGRVQPGHIHIPNGFGTAYPDPKTGRLETAGVCINDLTDAKDRDPFTGCPHFKFLSCHVEIVS